MSEREPNWHREVLPAGWDRAARELATRSLLGGFYLAGGTGLAVQLGHRRSADLDLFSQPEFSTADLRTRLRDLEGLHDLETAPGTLHVELRDIKVSFLHYPYPLLFPARQFDVLTVADPRDIACMKFDAIANRGSRRDFVDLTHYVILGGSSADLELAPSKYVERLRERGNPMEAGTLAFGDLSHVERAAGCGAAAAEGGASG